MSLRFLQDAGLAPWDGRWHLVAFSIDEERRTARNALRAALVWTGAPLAGGLYVSPHPWEVRIEAVASKLGVADAIVYSDSDRMRLGSVDDAPTIAAQLWPVADIAERWKHFLDQAEPVLAAVRKNGSRGGFDRAQFLAAVISVSAGFEECLRHDPLLPPELRPASWPGVDARRLILDTNDLFAAGRAEVGLPALQRQYDHVLAEVAKALHT